MDRSIPMLLIGLAFGFGAGFAVAAGNGITLDGHDHADPAHHGHAAGTPAGHGDHGTPLVLPDGADAPTLGITLDRDRVSGWTLHIATTGFRFAPDRASGPHVAGEGHAHVYVNGEKRARVYGPWFHLADLPAGESRVEVVLTANDHRPLYIGARAVADAVTVSN